MFNAIDTDNSVQRSRRIAAAVLVALLSPATLIAARADSRACDDWFAGRARQQPAAFHSPSPGSGCFDGRLTQQSVSPLLAWLQQPQSRSSQLTIRSPGGDVRAALQIGRWLLDTDVKVYARDLCASSCANYVFLVGREPEALPDTLLLYHGGVSPSLITEAAAAVRSQISTATPQAIDREVMRVTHDAERQLADQRRLYADAGLPPTFLERFDLLSWQALPAKDCTPGAALADTGLITLTVQQYRTLGVQLAGDLVEDLDRVNDLLASSGGSDVAVCVAPAVLFE